MYKTAEGPRFVRGHAVTLALVGTSSLIYGALWGFLASENKRRGEGKEDHRTAHMSENEIAELGDESPRFLYTI